MSNRSTQQLIDERRANLPLPDQPGAASDFNSADGRTTNVGSGSISGNNDALRGPATGDSSVRTDGDKFKIKTEVFENVGRKNESGIPNDALTRDKKDARETVEATGKDSGYS
jgi:hypothetical protein